MSMMFTRSAARALLTNRVTRHNHTKLPEDVLLEIFDAYRLLYQLQPDYEKAWNGKDGWLKLAHVCIHWRRVLFLSSSRLHLHLLLTPRRPWNPVLRSLPHFPILLDYIMVSNSPLRWTEKEENLALAAISHRSRVRRIALQAPCLTRVLRALSHPFPELESLTLELHSIYARVPPKLVLPTTLLSGSAPCLLQLTLRIVEPEALSPLLSSTTGLEELALTIIVVPGALPEASFITNLQRMTHLRRLELKLFSPQWGTTVSPDPPPPATAGDVVTLLRFTDFIFEGHGSYLRILVDRLAAPSLQHLDIEYWDGSATFPIPQLCNFICDMECQFKVVHLDFLHCCVNFCAETHSRSDHTRLFGIAICEPFPWEQISQMLSVPLSTVEELTVGREIGRKISRLIQAEDQGGRIQWRGFFRHIRQVKIIRVEYILALYVAHSLQPDDRELDLDLLPALEQVKVYVPIDSDGNDQYVSICDAFEPFISARKQVGRPIRLSRIAYENMSLFEGCRLIGNGIIEPHVSS